MKIKKKYYIFENLKNSIPKSKKGIKKWTFINVQN
jgi:hypothetical protein